MPEVPHEDFDLRARMHLDGGAPPAHKAYNGTYSVRLDYLHRVQFVIFLLCRRKDGRKHVLRQSFPTIQVCERASEAMACWLLPNRDIDISGLGGALTLLFDRGLDA